MKLILKRKYIVSIVALCLLISGCAFQERTRTNRGLNSTILDYPIREVAFTSTEPGGLVLGIANVANFVCDVPGCSDSIKENKDKILRIIDQLKKHHVNMILFPEFSLTGYFWVDDSEPPLKDSESCWEYMKEGVLDNHKQWLKDEVQARLDEELQYIIFNTIRENPETISKVNSHKKFLNSTYIIDKSFDCEDIVANEQKAIYDKTFLPGIEKAYTTTNKKDYLVLKTQWGDFGFTTCYDMCFSQLYQEYALIHNVDAVIELSSWRGTGSGENGKREYALTCNGEDCSKDYPNYWGFTWDIMTSSRAATNQIWMIAANAVGQQKRGDYNFWGGSGVWSPAGINIVEASHDHEELLVVKNLPIKEYFRKEQKDFSYKNDFKLIYEPIPNSKDACLMDGCDSFTRWRR